MRDNETQYHGRELNDRIKVIGKYDTSGIIKVKKWTTVKLIEFVQWYVETFNRHLPV